MLAKAALCWPEDSGCSFNWLCQKTMDQAINSHQEKEREATCQPGPMASNQYRFKSSLWLNGQVLMAGTAGHQQSEPRCQFIRLFLRRPLSSVMNSNSESTACLRLDFPVGLSDQALQDLLSVLGAGGHMERKENEFQTSRVPETS